MSDLPPPAQSLRTLLSVHALIAAGIMIVVAVTGGSAARALAAAGAYFGLAGGWSCFRVWRAGRAERARGGAQEDQR